MVRVTKNKVYFFVIFCFVFLSPSFSQKRIPKKELIEHIHSDKFQRVLNKYDGNILFSGNVIFRHNGVELRSDSAVFYEKDNYFKAFSNVEMVSPRYKLSSNHLEYDGNTEIAIAEGNVVLRDSEQTLYTDKLEYDRKINKAFYNTGGTIISKENTINSYIGTYDVDTKVNTFQNNVVVNNKDYYIDSNGISFNSRGDFVDFFDKTTIQSKENPTRFIKTTNGKYYLSKKEAFLKDRSSVYSDGKSITADDLYYNQKTGFGKGEGNVLIDDPKEKRFIKGDLGQVYKELDSAFVTKNALAVKILKKDSLYLHADTLMVTQRDSVRLLRAYHKARFFKTDVQGKSDSISFSEKLGQLRLYKDPIVFSDGKQITGDTAVIFLNVKYERLDSVHIKNNAFVVSQRDTLFPKDFNQLKSKNMSAIFRNDSLEWVQAYGNAQSTFFLDQTNKKTKKKELLGINRSDCGIIEASFYRGQLDVISCKIDQKSHLYPPFDFPEEERFLPNFVWREKERFRNWHDIMSSVEQEVQTKIDSKKIKEKKVDARRQ